MLARARARKQYDQLVEVELSAWLASRQQAYDLIVSADTLCYFGALEQPPSGAEKYVRSALAEAKLEAIEIEHVVLRRERGHEVSGLLVSARRPVNNITPSVDSR